jgi:secreted PhoX family phosphatase
VDDLIVPPEFDRYVIVAWGDRLFADPQEYAGYNCDYTAFTPINRHRDGYLWINHEYVSFPISDGAPEAPSDLSGFPTSAQQVLGFTLDKSKTTQRFRYGEFMYNQGGSVVRIRKGSDGRYVPQQDAKNRRYHGLSGLRLNAQRKDAYTGITSWGENAYQKGDDNYLVGTGPPAVEVFQESSDGLSNRIIGTAFNCSECVDENNISCVVL